MEDNRIQARVRQQNNKLITDDRISYGANLEYSRDGSSATIGGTVYYRVEYSKPTLVKKTWQGLIGEYGWDHNILYIYEEYGKLSCPVRFFYVIFTTTELPERGTRENPWAITMTLIGESQGVVDGYQMECD